MNNGTQCVVGIMRVTWSCHRNKVADWPKWGSVVEKFRKIWFFAQFAQLAAILAPSPHVTQLLLPPRKYNILLYMWSGHWAIFQAKQNTFLHKTRPHAPLHTTTQQPHCVHIAIAYFAHHARSLGPPFVAKTGQVNFFAFQQWNGFIFQILQYLSHSNKTHLLSTSHWLQPVLHSLHRTPPNPIC